MTGHQKVSFLFCLGYCFNVHMFNAHVGMPETLTDHYMRMSYCLLFERLMRGELDFVDICRIAQSNTGI